jgi:hypothetical protein
MYNLAVSLTLTENKRLHGEKLLPLIRDSKTGQVSISPVILVDGETMSSIRSGLHDIVDKFIDDMIESGEFSEFSSEEEE